MSLETTKHCEFCGKEFTPSRGHGWARFCSNTCCNRSRNHASYEDFLKNGRKARGDARRERASNTFGLTIAERIAVIKAQCGSRDELWKASQSWTPAQRKFAKARWEALHPSSFFTMSGRY